jgi:hypothetical protein
MEIAQRIEAEIKHYLADPNPRHPFLRGFVAQHQVLPLYVDWDGFLGIRPNADIMLVLHESSLETAPELVKDARLRRLALFQGAKKYPWLGELIPSRPIDAVTCSGCDGTGQIIVEGVASDSIVCYCGGLGWLEAVEQEELRNMRERLA